MLAGLVAARVLYRGESLLSFKLQAGGFVAFFVLVLLGPLSMFTPRMARAKRKGMAEYGLLAQRYVESFEQKWVRDPAPSEEMRWVNPANKRMKPFGPDVSKRYPTVRKSDAETLTPPPTQNQIQVYVVT